MSVTPGFPPAAMIGQKTILDLINSGTRLDGRSLTDHRKLSIEVGVIEKANGSAKVTRSYGAAQIPQGPRIPLDPLL